MAAMGAWAEALAAMAVAVEAKEEVAQLPLLPNPADFT